MLVVTSVILALLPSVRALERKESMNIHLKPLINDFRKQAWKNIVLLCLCWRA